jgi:hypothetical protein
MFFKETERKAEAKKKQLLESSSEVNYVVTFLIFLMIKAMQECRFLGCDGVYFLCKPTFLRNVGSHKKYMAPHQKTAFFIVAAVKTSNFTKLCKFQ